ncbi:MAG TPA: HAMP domain-containing sensor histidine kinase [Candidatus Nanoarchaeia archaeon]
MLFGHLSQPFTPGRSLKIKIPFISALILFVIFGSASIILIRQNITFQKQSLLSQAKTFATLGTKPIGDSYSFYFESGYLKFREYLIDTLAMDESIIRIQIISVRGDILFDTINLESPLGSGSSDKIEDGKILQALPLNKQKEFRGENGDVTNIIVPYFDDFNSHPFSIRYFISYEAIYNTAEKAIMTIILLTLLILILTWASMTVLVRRLILSPLDKIVLAAGEISHGKLEGSIRLFTGDELENLATSLNQMTVTLRKNIEDLKELDKLKDEFVYLASHNLRSPLTVIKGYTSVLRQRKTIDSELKEYLKRIDISTNKLSELIESLLDLVSLEEKRKPLTMRPVDLARLLKEVVDKLGKKATEKKIIVSTRLPEGDVLKVNSNEQKLSQAFESLIDNAIKFNKEQGKVTVGLEKKNEKAVISIKDTGIGIAQAEQKNVFKKFHRATDMLAYNYEGVGLGLYLTKLIIEAHQGKIWFESEVGKGTTFYVELPIKEANLEG